MRMLLILILFFKAYVSGRSCDERRLIRINPENLVNPTPFGFSHITVDTKNAVAHIAGQVALNRKGEIVGDTLREQLRTVEGNLKVAMRAVHATTDDIIRMNAFMVNFMPDRDLQTYIRTGKRFGNAVGTIISVPSLALDGLLVEIEVDVAVKKSFVVKIRCN